MFYAEEPCRNLYHSSFCLYFHREPSHIPHIISHGGKQTMTKTLPPSITKVRYLRIYADETGGSHFDTVTVEQSLAAGAPPAAPFYVSKDGPASRHRFYTFQPGLDRRLAPVSHPPVPGPHVGCGGDGDDRRDEKALYAGGPRPAGRYYGQGARDEKYW